MFVVKPDGSAVTQISDHPVYRSVRAVAWSPDSTKVAYRGANDGVWAANVNGSGSWRLNQNSRLHGDALAWVSEPYPPTGSAVFDDVPSGHWSDLAVGWAVTNNITSGVSDTQVRPARDPHQSPK